MHLRDLRCRRTEQRHLVARTHQIVLRILDLVICITIDVVGEEPHRLHEREKAGRIRKVLLLHRSEERLRPLDVAL